MQSFNLEARSVFLSWKLGKFPPNTKFLLIKAQIEPLIFEDVYTGTECERLVENLKPSTKYQFILKITADPLTAIDDIEVETPDETAVQKAIFHLIRAVSEKDPAKVGSIFREFRNQIPVETCDRSGRSLLMVNSLFP